MSESDQGPSSELLERIKSFNEELQGLLAKHKLGLIAEPFIKGGRVFARPVLVDDNAPRPPSEALQPTQTQSVDPEPPATKVESGLAEA